MTHSLPSSISKIFITGPGFYDMGYVMSKIPNCHTKPIFTKIRTPTYHRLRNNLTLPTLNKMSFDISYMKIKIMMNEKTHKTIFK